MIEAWKKAAKDLQIKIKTPFVLMNDHNQELIYDLLIENFGGELGTIITSMHDSTDTKTLKKYGYYSSKLNPEGYSTYDRQLFIDTLNDWGYFGDKENKPDWYTGQPWTA